MTLNNNDIRAKEDELFLRWRKKYQETSFLIDGCPNPAIYVQVYPRIVFVLKDGNIGNPDSNAPPDKRIHDQRYELEHEPDSWHGWRTIAIWSHVLRHPLVSWREAQEAIQGPLEIRDALSHHCIMQLKKEWGIGTLANNNLLVVARRDRDEIVEQLSIYQPDFIVACGNGDSLSWVLGCTAKGRKQTTYGVGYWKVGLFAKCCHLIDFCHPVNRAGSKVSGLIGIGLASTILGIQKEIPNGV